MYQPTLSELQAKDPMFETTNYESKLSLVAEPSDPPRLQLHQTGPNSVAIAMSVEAVTLLHDAMGVWLRAVHHEEPSELQRQAEEIVDSPEYGEAEDEG